MKLDQRVVLITGAGTGIGAELAKAAAQQGATIILLGRNVAKLEAVYDAIVAAGGADPAIYPLNLEGAKPHDFQDLADRIEDEFGALHGCVHNAALLGRPAPLVECDPDDWMKLMQVNVNAPFLISKACLPLLLKSDNARLLFTLHEARRAFWNAYGVSKAGLEALMQIIADEVTAAHSLRVFGVNPGESRSPINLKAYPGKHYQSVRPIEDLIPTYLDLLSSQTDALNGAVIDL